MSREASRAPEDTYLPIYLHQCCHEGTIAVRFWACFLDFTLGFVTSEVVLGILVGLHSDFRDLGLLILVDFS